MNIGNRTIRSLFLSPTRLVWLIALLCVFPTCAQSQNLAVVQPSGTEESIGQPLLGDQSAGSISGTVVDRTGATIVAALVTLSRGDQSQSQEVSSDDNGQFSFANLVPGPFQITITAAGFAAQTFAGRLCPNESYVAKPATLDLATAVSEVRVIVPRSQVAEDEVKVEEKQRVLGFVPNFYVSYIPDAVPLTSKQKFELAWKMTLDPVTFALTGVVAGNEQAQNDFSAYGQGPRGYARRFGAAYADTATSTLIAGAILPSLLRQDPRYFYKGTGRTGSRILYAIANSVICLGDNQRWQPNYSNILGNLAAGGISNLYYPSEDRGIGLTFENALIQIGTSATTNLLEEFVLRKLTPNAPYRYRAKS
jgi:hypothetical protein